MCLLAGFRFHQGHARCYSVSIRISPIANVDHQNESSAMMFADLVDQVDFLFKVYLSEVCR